MIEKKQSRYLDSAYSSYYRGVANMRDAIYDNQPISAYDRKLYIWDMQNRHQNSPVSIRLKQELALRAANIRIETKTSVERGELHSWEVCKDKPEDLKIYTQPHFEQGFAFGMEANRYILGTGLENDFASSINYILPIAIKDPTQYSRAIRRDGLKTYKNELHAATTSAADPLRELTQDMTNGLFTDDEAAHFKAGVGLARRAAFNISGAIYQKFNTMVAGLDTEDVSYIYE